MATTARLEMRVPPERAELIRRAAAARGESVTSFVLEAATKAAEAELAVVRETLVPPEFFDQLLAALDAPDKVSEELRELASRPRLSARVSRYRSQHLSPGHDLDPFDSGNLILDDWLRRFARHAEGANTGRTFVWVDTGSRIVAYFTLAAHLLRRADMPKRIGRGSPDVIPAILLARLALDRSLQGQGLGGQLLLDALERAVDASTRAAARFLVVDAIDDTAASFYRRYGFQSCPDTDRLVRKTSEVAASLHDQ